ncbi:hypothetical protein IWW38_004403, partial [Coemansia aciculifera]
MSRMLWLATTRNLCVAKYGYGLSLQVRSISQFKDVDSPSAQIDLLDKQSVNLPTPESPASVAASEQQALDMMSKCYRLLLEHVSTMNNTDVLRLCEVADRLGQQTMSQQLHMSPDLFSKYLQFYAHLGRPDITQQAFDRVKRRWRQPSLAVYDAQQLALLRYVADNATGGSMLTKTLLPGESVKDLAGKIDHRLNTRSVSAAIRDIMRHERRTRQLVKALEYGSYAALVALIAKWMWIGNSVALAGMGVVPRILASSAALIVTGTGICWVLRRSVMGTLTTPALLSRNDTRFGHSTAAEIDLPAESDTEARQILRRAFPASPSDEAMLDINEILYASSTSTQRRPRLSWRLRLALSWSRLARRFAVVEPMLTSTHDMHQQLAAMWLRNMVQMFPPSVSSSGEKDSRQMAAASEAIQEFACFVKQTFSTIPLALTRNEISALSAFAVQEASTEAFADFLRLVDSGSLGLVANVVPRERHSTAIMRSDDVTKHRAGATVLAYISCFQQLNSESSKSEYQSKTNTLLSALLSDLEMPVSASLYHAAFATANRTLAVSQQLADSLETRFLAHDPFTLHIVR